MITIKINIVHTICTCPISNIATEAHGNQVLVRWVELNPQMY